MAVSSIRIFNSLKLPGASLIAYSTVNSTSPSSLDYNSFWVKGGFVSSSISGSPRVRAVIRDKGEKPEDHPLAGDSMDNFYDKQRDFAGTPYVPVYVMLPLGVFYMNCELIDPKSLLDQLRILKSVNVDGVMIDCWWGIVETHTPQVYNWSGYKRLFQIVRDLGLKLQMSTSALSNAQVVMSFHECGGNVGDDVHIPLPQWVSEIGQSNPDIYFTDREGRRNSESLTWGIDKEQVLKGRTAVEVYFDYMRSFHVEFDEFFVDGIISEIKVGLGPCGELRYPSYPAKHVWRYPGIGEFQCYDKYLLKRLSKAAEIRGHSFWARGPDKAGSYNSTPQETEFFRDGGDYDSYYGSNVEKAAMLKKHRVSLNFTCFELHTLDLHEGFPEALADPEGLVWQTPTFSQVEESLDQGHSVGYHIYGWEAVPDLQLFPNQKPATPEEKDGHIAA
ncbi:hypothetical protein CRYUN_Cryun20dG0025700 [Craigia yunnanensis]